MLKQGGKALEELSGKSKIEILQFFIQAKINELEKSDDPDYDKLDELQKQLIATEKSETTLKVDRDSKENNLIEAINKTDLKIASLRGALLDNPKIKENSKIKTINDFFDEYGVIAKNPDNLDGEKLELAKQSKLDGIISFLKNP